MSNKHSHRPDGSHSRTEKEAHPEPKHTEPSHAHGAQADPATPGITVPPFRPDCTGAVGGIFADAQGDTAAPQADDAGIPYDTLVAQCRDRVCVICPIKKEADDARLRALADMDNARKRMAREKDENVLFAAEKVLKDILPGLDNLELALQHASKDAVCKDFVMGVEMTRNLLLSSLAKHGLEVIGEVGQLFDPNLHEAVGMADSSTVENGQVCALLGCGYKLRDRLLRPARVMVCKKG